MKTLLFIFISYLISWCTAQYITKICETNYYDTNIRSYPTIRYDTNKNMYVAGIKRDNSAFVILKYDQNCNELWFKEYNKPYGINIYYGNNPIPTLNNMTIATVRKQNKGEQDLIFIPIPNVLIMRGSTRLYRSYILILDTETGNKEWCGLVDTSMSRVTYKYERVGSVFIDTSGALILSMVFTANSGTMRGNSLIKYSSHIPISSNKMWDLSFEGWHYSHSVIIDVIERENVIYVSTYLEQVKKINSITGEILWTQYLRNVNLGKLLVDTTGHIWVTGTSRLPSYTSAALFGDCVSCTSYLVKLNKDNGRIIKGISYENWNARLTAGIPTSWSRLSLNRKSWYRYSPVFEFVLHPSIANHALVIVPLYSGYTLHIVLDLTMGIIIDKYFIGEVLENLWTLERGYIIFNNVSYSEVRWSNSGLNLKSFSFHNKEITTTTPSTTNIINTRIATVTATATATETATQTATATETATQTATATETATQTATATETATHTATATATIVSLITSYPLTSIPISNNVNPDYLEDTTSTEKPILDIDNSVNNIDNSKISNFDNSNKIVNNVSINLGVTIGLSVALGIVVLVSLFYYLRRLRYLRTNQNQNNMNNHNLSPIVTAPPPINPELSVV